MEPCVTVIVTPANEELVSITEKQKKEIEELKEKNERLKKDAEKLRQGIEVALAMIKEVEKESKERARYS